MTRTQSSPTTIRRTRAAWLVAIAAVIALGGVSGTAQGQGQRRDRVLFADGGSVEDAPGNADPTKRRGRRVRANVMALHDTSGPSAGDITLNLFDDVQLRARRLRLEPTVRGGSVWHGRLLDIAGDATIAVNDGVMAGTVFAEDRVYEILYAGDGEHEVREIEPSAFPTDDPHVDLPLVEPDAQAGVLDPLVEANAAADSASQIDVMVVWTPAARTAAGGSAAMQSLVDLSVANTNTAYANSNVTQRIRLVYSGEVSYTESSISTDLSRLTSTADGNMDTVHSLRNTYGADVVTLIGNGYASAGACGLGYLMSYVSTGFASTAFNVVDRTCSAGNLSFPHELGHNMGLQHDPGNASSSPAYSYAYGYQDPGGSFRTVMSYGGAPRITRFSNPNLTYNGKVTGTSTQNNALALNNTASSVANFRQATVGGGCTYSLGSSSTSVGSSSASGTVSVVAGSGCTWTATSNAAWMTVTSGASGTSNGSVGYSVAANTAGTSRTGTLTIGGQTFTVTQAAATCGAFTLSPTSTNVVAGGGTVTVTVSGTEGCARTATSNAAWITVTAGASGTGAGTVSLSVAANTAGTSRTGTVTIGGQSFTVTQAASLAVSSLRASVSLPAMQGTAVTWTPTVTGGTGPYQYKYVMYKEGSGWSVAREYSTTSTFTHTPTGGRYVMQVWVRNAGSTSQYDAWGTSGYFDITSSAALSLPVTVTMAADRPFPLSGGSSVTFTATAAGGTGTLEYRFVTYNPVRGWQVGREYSSTSTFTYVPPGGENVVQVWVRSVGAAVAYDAWATSGYFTVTPVSSPIVHGVTANVALPVAAGTAVTFTATASGGSGLLEYRFVTYHPSFGWQAGREYSASNSFTYTPPVGSSNVLQVWVRSVGSTAAYDAWGTTGYFTILP